MLKIVIYFIFGKSLKKNLIRIFKKYIKITDPVTLTKIKGSFVRKNIGI